jgi:hypothetical protein
LMRHECADHANNGFSGGPPKDTPSDECEKSHKQR